MKEGSGEGAPVLDVPPGGAPALDTRPARQSGAEAQPTLPGRVSHRHLSQDPLSECTNAANLSSGHSSLSVLDTGTFLAPLGGL